LIPFHWLSATDSTPLMGRSSANRAPMDGFSLARDWPVIGHARPRFLASTIHLEATAWLTEAKKRGSSWRNVAEQKVNV
jgi:hypothetical protein